MGLHTKTREAELRAAVAEKVGETRFGLWFGEGVTLGLDGDALHVGVPSRFFRDRMSQFSGSLIEAAESVAGRPLKLQFKIDAEAEPRVGQVVETHGSDPSRRSAPPTAPTPAPIPIPKPAPGPPSQDRPRAQARPARSLDNFVTGPNNRLALAAATEMVRSPGAAFNPLVIHGGVGLGKTHLLEGVGAALKARHPGLKIIHVTAEAFTNGFLDAMRAASLPSFRARYRGAEALILDDVHFLATTRATQNEFLHTFNALASTGVPIVLSSDQHPRLISKLTDELITRFLGGMVVKLEPPDLATRKAILRAKAAARGVLVPDAVIDYVAEHLRASVRELEGALHSLIAHATLVGKRLDLALARTALRDTIRHTAQAVALKDIERAICGLFQVEADALKSDTRSRAVAQPRMLAMYLARKHTGAAYSEIGRYFGGRNHSTVIAAEKKVLDWLKDAQRHAFLAGFESVADVLAALERSLGA